MYPRYREHLIEMFGTADTKKIKRIERKMNMADEVMVAYYRGSDQGDRGKPYRNPYPPGKRHDEFKRAYFQQDPMGDHHGRNV